MLASMRKRRNGQKRTFSPLSVLFRVGLSAIGVLTVLDVSHTIRYAILGILLVVLAGEYLYSERRKRAKRVSTD